MATPTGTITLQADVVLVEKFTDSGLIANGNLMLVKIIDKGSNVSVWADNDIIAVNAANTFGFQDNSSPFYVVNQEFIYFKYVAAPAP